MGGDAPVRAREDPERPRERDERQADGGEPGRRLVRRQQDVAREAPATGEQGEEEQHRHHPQAQAAARRRLPLAVVLLGRHRRRRVS